MKNALLGSFLVAAATGAVSAALTLVLMGTRDGASRSAAPSVVPPRQPPSVSGANEATDEDYAHLLLTQRELEQRLAALELATVEGERRALPAAERDAWPASSDEFEREVRAWMASRSGDGLGPTELVENVRAAVDHLREEERLERERAEEEREAQRLEERLARLASDLDLAQHQIGDLRTLFQENDAAQAALRAEREAGQAREVYREARQALREQRDARLAAILTPTQLALYDARGERDDERRADDSSGSERRRGRDDGGRERREVRSR